MLSSAANRARSMPIITGRLRRNSIQGPSGTATAAPAASPAADSADTPAGPACSTRIAISANAPNPNPVPYALTAYAAHNHPNCRPSDRQAFLPHARGLLQAEERAAASVRPGRRALRIDVIARRLGTAGLLRDFHRAHPRTELDVVTLFDAGAAIAAVHDGTIDASF